MKMLLRRFWQFPFFVQLLWLLSMVGVFANLALIMRDLSSNAILLRLHLGFFILYASQAAFILAREKYVCVLTLLQGVMALLTTADFLFVPILQILGRVYYVLCSPTIEALKVYRYVFVSAAFTLQLFSAGYLWSTFAYGRKQAK